MKSLLSVCFLFISITVAAQSPVAMWNFDKMYDGKTVEAISGSGDTVEGNTFEAAGVKGQGLRFDGFTSCVATTGNNRVIRSREISIESWVSLGNYPWNWCPVISTISDETKGYRLMVGPLGQASFEVAIGEQWVACTGPESILPLRTWMHITGVYAENQYLKLFVNGQLVATTEIHGPASIPNNGYLIGMVTTPEKPSDIHRTWGTIEQFFGLDGILDEISIFNTALTDQQVKSLYSAVSPGIPDIQPRKLPTVKNPPQRFGAYYTKLQYYPGWDDLWPVDQDPDIVVTFKDSPVKLIFWRGTRYGASWVSENENWMTDQSVEAWGVGDEDNEGCFEHMQDRHCRYSHVRIIENTDARVVVHWRYAPTSAYLSTWRVDPKTGWECWVDEYYYIYPDATAIRKVSWKKGTLGYPRQFQETLALLQPGQTNEDLLEQKYSWVGDYEGASSYQAFVEDPSKPPYGPFTWNDPKDFTMQLYNYKSENKPFICFEPGNKMHLRNAALSGYSKAGGCNHFPVGQARCDGRTTRTDDRPSHTLGFPISDPVLHEKGDRKWWNGLYGMQNIAPEQLIQLGRSWAYAPELTVSQGFENSGYDSSERIYRIKDLRTNNENLAGSQKIQLQLKATSGSPVWNPAIYISNWKGGEPRILVNGQAVDGIRKGINRHLDGQDLIIYIPLKSEKKVIIELTPEA